MSGDLTETIRDLARQAGFLAVGFAPATVTHTDRLLAWLEQGFSADMRSIGQNLSKRLDPAELVAGARSVICLAVSYAPPADADRDGLVARYARGADYHDVLLRRCERLMADIRAIEPSFAGRAFAAAAPIMARTLAAEAGLGWIGRNGCVFVAGAGSYCVLAEIVCNLPLPPGEPLPACCGDCRACVDACPTGALQGNGLVDARRCISYLTLEHRGAIDPALWPKMGMRLFGCDGCQSVCPHNRSLPAGDAELTTPGALARATLAEMLAWSEADWQAAAAGTAPRRATYEMFLRNAVLAAGNSGDASLAPALRRLAGNGTLAEMVRWALGQLGGGPE